MNLVIIIIVAYLIATLWEHYFHSDVLHAHTDVVKRWRGSDFWLYKMLYHGYYAHHVVHHRLTFQKEYTKQFDTKEQKKKVDDYLVAQFGRTEDSQNYGLTISSIYEYLMFMLPMVFLLPFLIIWLEVFEIVIFTLLMSLPLLLSKYIHPLLHREIEDNWFYNNAYIKLIYKTHSIHHQNDSKNFNLLWGGDWLRGSYLAPKIER